MFDLFLLVDSTAHFYLPDNSVIDSVREFYEDSWNKLIWFLSALGAIVGIFVPWYLNREQRRNYRDREEALLNSFETRLQSEVTSAREDLENRFSEIVQLEVKKVDAKSKTTESRLQGMIYHLQGNMLNYNLNNKGDAFISCLKAIQSYGTSDVDEPILLSQLRWAKTLCNQLSKSTLLKSEKEYLSHATFSVIDAIHGFKTLPRLKLYSKEIDELLNAVNALP